MLVLDYNNRYKTDETDEVLERKLRSERLQDLRMRTDYWFKDNWLTHRMVGKYEYFGTFNFDGYWVRDKTFEDIQKEIRHFKKVLGTKLFGRKFNTKTVYLKMNTGGTNFKFEYKDNFNINFFSVIETVKWEKKFKKYVDVRKHVHILFGEPPQGCRLDKDFETLVVETWMKLKNSGTRDEQLVKKIYGTDTDTCGEGYITKLRHSNVDWLDGMNFTEIKGQHLLDEDITDWIERNSDEIYKGNYLKK